MKWPTEAQIMKSTDDHKKACSVNIRASSSMQILPTNLLDLTNNLLEVSNFALCSLAFLWPTQCNGLPALEQPRGCVGADHWMGQLETIHT